MITVEVLKHPPVLKRLIPAEFKTVTSRVLKKPATVQTEISPAEYTNVTKRKLVKAVALPNGAR